jgi:hypothetical protein
MERVPFPEDVTQEVVNYKRTLSEIDPTTPPGQMVLHEDNPADAWDYPKTHPSEGILYRSVLILAIFVLICIWNGWIV